MTHNVSTVIIHADIAIVPGGSLVTGRAAAGDEMFKANASRRARPSAPPGNVYEH